MPRTTDADLNQPHVTIHRFPFGSSDCSMSVAHVEHVDGFDILVRRDSVDGKELERTKFWRDCWCFSRTGMHVDTLINPRADDLDNLGEDPAEPCLYCRREPVDAAFDPYCGTECAALAANESEGD